MILSKPENMAVVKNAVQRASGELYAIKFSDSSEKKQPTDDVFVELLNNANDILYKE